MSYLLSEAKEIRRAASYIDRVLRGARPGDLPVEQPSNHLMFNLTTANALGLTNVICVSVCDETSVGQTK